MSDTQTRSAPDELVPDIQVRKEFGGVTDQTIRRWDRDPKLAFPPKIVIRRHNFRSRHALEEFKQHMTAQAIKGRGKKRGRK